MVICASGGEKDEPVDSLVGRCVQQTGIPKALPPLRIQAGSEEKTLAFYEDSGRQLAKNMLEKKKKAAKDKLDQKTTEALGKMGSGRYIVTGLKGEVSSAAVADADRRSLRGQYVGGGQLPGLEKHFQKDI